MKNSNNTKNNNNNNKDNDNDNDNKIINSQIWLTNKRVKFHSFP